MPSSISQFFNTHYPGSNGNAPEMRMLDLAERLKGTTRRKEEILAAAEKAGRPMDAKERAEYQTAFAQETDLQTEMNRRQSESPLARINPMHLLDAGRGPGERASGGWDSPGRSQTRTAAYARSFCAWLRGKGTMLPEEIHAGADGTGGFLLPGSERLAPDSNGPRMSAALDEGTPGSGGYALPTVTVPQIVPLGMPDLGIFNESTVIPTANDQKWPIQASFGQAAAKAESGSSTNAFSEIDPTIGSFTLSAFMAGGLRLISWELLQDVPMFQQFAVDDLIKAQLIYEGNLYVNGSGSGQAQGVLGNVGTGTGSAYELVGTAATDNQTLLNAVFDVVGTLKAAYQPNAVFVMSRATAMALRRAQMGTNLYNPAITTAPDGTDFLLGHRIAYDTNMPNLPTATSSGVVPILYGSFKDGYLIGVRGGAGVNVKILDQPWAVDGQTGILAYRRVDGRVRRSEAIQAITISHS
jgi:HK97 family phage major capsid protein